MLRLGTGGAAFDVQTRGPVLLEGELQRLEVVVVVLDHDHIRCSFHDLPAFVQADATVPSACTLSDRGTVKVNVVP